MIIKIHCTSWHLALLLLVVRMQSAEAAAAEVAAFAPPRRHRPSLPSPSCVSGPHQFRIRHSPNNLFLSSSDGNNSKFPDDPILRRIKDRSGPSESDSLRPGEPLLLRPRFGGRRRMLVRRKSLPKWFRRFLVSSKFSNMLRLPNQDQDSNKDEQGGENGAGDKEEIQEKDDKGKSSSIRLPGSRVLRLLLSTPLVEFKLSLLVLLSSVFVAAGTVQSIPASVHAVITFGENGIAFIFLIEYLLRWYCNGLRLGHLVKPLVIVDFLSILPLIAQRITLPFGSRVLQDNLLVNLRLLRLLRLQRFLVDFKTFERFQQSTGISFGQSVRRYHLQLARVILTIFTMSAVSAGLIYAAECELNPTLKDIPSALYFVVTTITTCGFGDIAPQTAVGRMIVCAMIFAGAAIIPLQVSQFLEALLDFRRDMEEKKQAGKRKDEDEEDDEKAYELTEVMQPDGSYKKVKTSKLLECQVCNAKPHGKKATFCWSCGSPLWAVRANYLAEKSSEDSGGSGVDQEINGAGATSPEPT